MAELAGKVSISRTLLYFTIFYCSTQVYPLPPTPSVQRRDDLERSSDAHEYCGYDGGAILANLVSKLGENLIATSTSIWRVMYYNIMILFGVVGAVPLHCVALHRETRTRQGMVCSPSFPFPFRWKGTNTSKAWVFRCRPVSRHCY